MLGCSYYLYTTDPKHTLQCVTVLFRITEAPDPATKREADHKRIQKVTENKIIIYIYLERHFN